MAELFFPTELHRKATRQIELFFLEQPGVDTILLVNSLARGKATAQSDIDMAILVSRSTTFTEIKRIEGNWNKFLNFDSTLQQFRSSGKFAEIHVDLIDGRFEPAIWEKGGGVDFFEVEIGNRLLYSTALGSKGEYLKNLQKKWLPYYDEKLQRQRFDLSKSACLYELEHIPILVARSLYFQAFDRLYMAFQKFLQTLFIKHKTYPIAYNKWIKEQIVDIMNLPELYVELPGLISVKNLESNEINEKAKRLEQLLKSYC
jgi:predicted nucleotidyltransferase